MASAAVAPPDQSAEASHGINPWLIAASVMLATFMEVLDTAIASVALPYIAGSLSASTDEATWVLTSYLVANAIVLPASNWFSLRFGRKRFLMSCVAIFTVASFACGAAPTLAIFMINRFIHDPAYISKAKVAPLDRYGFAALVIWTGCLQVILDKGQEDDWFGALWLRWATFFLVISFIYFCWHCWRDKNTIVDLKVLKDRNFLIGCTLIFMFGIGIYSTVTVLPLFYQELLGYTAFTAGLVVAPRGIGAICGMPIIGYLSNKVDPRYLLTFGFLTFGLTTLYFGNITLDVSPTTLLLPILITGFGLSFVFVPISTAAYGTLDNKQIGNASGLFNLMRNVGGSIVISIAATLLTRRSDVHQNEILNHVPRTGALFQERLNGAQHMLAGHFGAPNSGGPAAGVLYRELIRQAALWSFVDVFRWLSMLCLICV